MSKWYVSLALIVTASLLMVACQSPLVPTRTRTSIGSTGGSKSKDPTTWTQVSSGQPETLDPALDYETAGAEILLYVYDTLIFYNKEKPNEFVPNLATQVPSQENRGISADGKTYTFKIRAGVKFHDQSILNVEDVAYTFQRGILQGGLNSPQLLFTEALFGPKVDDVAVLVDRQNPPYNDAAMLKKAGADRLKQVCELIKSRISVDEKASTVSFKLDQPWAPFLATFAGQWGSITSKNWVISNGGWDGDCGTWQNYYGVTPQQSMNTRIGSAPMGTGPYQFDHWNQGDEIVLTANENYWRKQPAWPGGPTGAPAIKKIVFKNIDEFSKRLAMLQAGDADYIQMNSEQWSVMDRSVGEQCDYSSGECGLSSDPSQPLREYRDFATGNRTDLFFNYQVDPSENTFIGSGQLDGYGIPPNFFSDIHIRKAFAYCFDDERFLQVALLGEGVRSKTVMLPGMPGYDNNQPVYQYDLGKCATEFKSSTWKNGAGQRLWDVGFHLTAVYNTGNTARQTIAQILQQNLARVNDKFVIELQGLPWPNFLRALRARQLPLFAFGWVMDLYDSHDWVVPYTTGSIGSRQNLPVELQDRFEQINIRAVTEMDPSRRSAIYKEFNRYYYEQIPGLLLYQQTGRRYVPKYVHGFFYNQILNAISDIYIYALTKD